jgi:GNAT superfamily N-acetyltransferase
MRQILLGLAGDLVHGALSGVGFVNAGAGREAPGGFESEIYAIYLLRAHQGRGTGAALFRAAVQWLAEEDFQNMSEVQITRN